MKCFILALAALICSLPAPLPAAPVGDTVEVAIVTDDGHPLPLYPAASRSSARKVYAEATKGDHYRILVTNRLSRRVGLVIAVDGRNIISGKKSWLASSERKYILEPYATGEFGGWRTGDDRINRFFFTDAGNSYAAAFKDESAMGVIAVAAYPEVIRYQTPRGYEQSLHDRSATAGSPATAAPATELKARTMAKREERAGTGYGHEEYSPVTTVAFEPETRATEKVLIKYEWRATLCREGIIRCEPPRSPRNRFWDNDGYAPPPPRRG